MGEKTKDKKKSEKKAQKTSWFQGMKSEFKKVICETNGSSRFSVRFFRGIDFSYRCYRKIRY